MIQIKRESLTFGHATRIAQKGKKQQIPHAAFCDEVVFCYREAISIKTFINFYYQVLRIREKRASVPWLPHVLFSREYISRGKSSAQLTATRYQEVKGVIFA